MEAAALKHVGLSRKCVMPSESVEVSQVCLVALARPCQPLSVGRAAMLRSEPHHLTLPTATGGLAHLAAREVRAAGIDLEPLLRASRLSWAQIQDTKER